MAKAVRQLRERVPPLLDLSPIEPLSGYDLRAIPDRRLSDEWLAKPWK
jgi:hypothetical protein